MYVSCNPDSLVEDRLGQKKGKDGGLVWLSVAKKVKRCGRKQNMEVFFQG